MNTKWVAKCKITREGEEKTLKWTKVIEFRFCAGDELLQSLAMCWKEKKWAEKSFHRVQPLAFTEGRKREKLYFQLCFQFCITATLAKYDSKKNSKICKWKLSVVISFFHYPMEKKQAVHRIDSFFGINFQFYFVSSNIWKP